MKQFILFLIIMSGMAVSAHAQETTGNNHQEPSLVAEISKMVELDTTQTKALKNLYASYAAGLSYAINHEPDQAEAAKLIYETKKKFNTRFMKLLSDKQKIEYVRNSFYSEVMEETVVEVKELQKTEQYSEKELEKATLEIFEYLMLEKIAYVCDKYNIERQKENIAQLKKYEPEALKTANARQQAKHQGITYQNGYQW